MPQYWGNSWGTNFWGEHSPSRNTSKLGPWAVSIKPGLILFLCPWPMLLYNPGVTPEIDLIILNASKRLWTIGHVTLFHFHTLLIHLFNFQSNFLRSWYFVDVLGTAPCYAHTPASTEVAPMKTFGKADDCKICPQSTASYQTRRQEWGRPRRAER